MQNRDLESYTQPAMLIDGTRVTACNDKALALFPGLTPGQTLPDALLPLEDAQAWEGLVVLEGRGYRTRCSREDGQLLYTFQPQEQQALSEGQLDGALYQVRMLMGELYYELSPCVSGTAPGLSKQNKDHVSKSYYRMLRLMDHLDFLRDAAGGGLRLDQRELDFGLLCAEAAVECDGLLREMDVRVQYAGPPAALCVAGDERLLRDALVELISNCAKRLRRGGVITLRLRKRGEQALLCVTDDGEAATQRQRLGLTTRGAAPRIPMPEDGAGLGLSVAERVIQLHGGALLVSAGQDAPRVYLSLPLKRGRHSATLHAPRMERNAGMSPYVIALSDVLPGTVIREDWKD